MARYIQRIALLGKERWIGWEIAKHFGPSIRRVADPFSDRTLFSLLRGRTPSLLELDGRPAAYEDVGRAVRWGSLLPRLTRSLYEKVFLHLGTRKPVTIDRELLTPVGVKGWYHAVFRDPAGDTRLLSIDQILDALAFDSQ